MLPLPPSHSRPRAHRATALATFLVMLALVATTAAVPSQAASAARRALFVGPQIYVAGQAVTFNGALGRAGKQRVRLQMHMGRPGDSWTNVPGSRSVTDARGAFRFVHPAPAMFNISYRVASKREATPAWKFRSRSQEILLTHSTAVPGRTFTITADTSPPVRGGGYDLTPPIFAGRTLTLQERTGITWRNLATTTADSSGIGRFDVTAPTSGSEHVYRVRAEDYFTGQNRIGWFPSFPLYVGTGRNILGREADARVTTASAATAPEIAPTSRARSGAGTASQSRSWGPSLFDFAWESGESLTSNAYRGTRRSGRWEDSSNGTGRAVHYNGGLALQSQLLRSGLQDRGTTAATLQGNAQRTGRWEFKLRSVIGERGARPYRAVVELVDESRGTAACTPSAITVADFTLGSAGMGVGVTSARTGSQWRSQIKSFQLASDAISVAVEVGRKHVSWFANGRLVATVRNRSAVPTGALTPRLSLVGAGDQEMNSTMLISDWQRAWTLDRGPQSKNGARLKRSAYAPSC